jgi:hypothetical protein
MTNTINPFWLKKDYTKRAFKKRLGLFDKDVAIEELEEQVRMEMEEEEEQLLIDWNEQLDKQPQQD